MNNNIITAEDFYHMINMTVSADIVLEILKLHNIEFDVFTVPALTLEERIASQVKQSNYITICLKASDSFVPNNSSNKNNPMLLCWVIYIDGIDCLINILQKSIKMKGFL